MQVFVVGGTGAIGMHAVAALVRAGHIGTALARTVPKAQQFRLQGATPVQISLFDPAALTDAFRGHAAVVNLATAIPPTAQFMRQPPGPPMPASGSRARPPSPLLPSPPASGAWCKSS